MLSEMLRRAGSRQQDLMSAAIGRFQSDLKLLERLFVPSYSKGKHDRLVAFLSEWLNDLAQSDFDSLTPSDRLDCLLFQHELRCRLRQLDRERERRRVAEWLVPGASSLVALAEARRRREETDPKAAAAVLSEAAQGFRNCRSELSDKSASSDSESVQPHIALRAAQFLEEVKTALGGWHSFHSGFDPDFTWWTETPYRDLIAVLGDYADFLRKEVARAEKPDAIVGDPVGPEVLEELIAEALLPHSSGDLIAIAAREKQWCLDRLREASAEMGLGDDWKATLERVKEEHVPPGRQAALVRELAEEAIRFVEERDLLTIPPLLRECWQMEMMPSEKQKINPFFLGGETIHISFPSSDMSHEFKRMSLRGNNRHFARATVQHELIPGHAMQAWAEGRHSPHRSLFATPFWTEGWTLHWEMLLWDLGFPRTPEERIGMLFWRLHRCVRVEFSLRFHRGELTPEQCVEMLVEEVGHERENALGEVRRSFGGEYDPLYQCAYLIGGLQVRSLHREMTGSGAMTGRHFHDRFLEEGPMPIAAMRAAMKGVHLSPETDLLSMAPDIE